jgi:hypothetical protein
MNLDEKDIVEFKVMDKKRLLQRPAKQELGLACNVETCYIRSLKFTDV